MKKLVDRTNPERLSGVAQDMVEQHSEKAFSH
jgi:hypothetical protein